MQVLKSRLSAGAPNFQAALLQYRAIEADLIKRRQEVAAGSSPESVKRHRARNKMLPRERLDALVDPGSALLELSPLAAYGVYEEEAPSAGLITGIGRVEGVLCMMIANDATVKGGTYHPLTVKKHIRAQTIAEENHL
ncbi:MAG TPA: carboxyl transferase domain-containing protein, partial [Planctomycetota bacterium]|nr:carboxyl transferase domain-containing protein [Planctomycetota bacterium]